MDVKIASKHITVPHSLIHGVHTAQTVAMDDSLGQFANPTRVDLSHHRQLNFHPASIYAWLLLFHAVHNARSSIMQTYIPIQYKNGYCCRSYINQTYLLSLMKWSLTSCMAIMRGLEFDDGW